MAKQTQMFERGAIYRGSSSRWLLLFALMGSGCAHRQLARNTALTATTVNSIQYRMVLDNLAMMSCEPANLPAHVRLADGTVQISNEAGFGESGGFTLARSLSFGFESWGPAGSTKISEQWGTDAVEDPIQLWALQTIYRKALALHPLDEPNFIVAAKKSRAKDSPGKSSSHRDSRNESEREEVMAVAHTVWRNGDSRDGEDPEDDLRPAGSSDDEESIDAELDASEFDIPIGWFGVGSKHDVPPDACYVGRYRDRYAWVTAGEVENLARFTLAVLTITKLEAGETSGSTGLMFTP